MSTDAQQPETIDPATDPAPKATDHAEDLDDVPAVAGGKDDTDPAQGEGTEESY